MLIGAYRAGARRSRTARVSAGTSATDASADTDATATRTALDVAEKCVALLRAELVDHNVGGRTDGDPSAHNDASA